MTAESYGKYFDPRLTRQNVLTYKTKSLFLQNRNSECCVRSSDGVNNKYIWSCKDFVSCCLEDQSTDKLAILRLTER
jgi:hypothetical protein